jgi:hypothetical protein
MSGTVPAIRGDFSKLTIEGAGRSAATDVVTWHLCTNLRFHPDIASRKRP